MDYDAKIAYEGLCLFRYVHYEHYKMSFRNMDIFKELYNKFEEIYGDRWTVNMMNECQTVARNKYKTNKEDCIKFVNDVYKDYLNEMSKIGDDDESDDE